MLKRRGLHPQDAKLFAEDQLPALRKAVSDFSWLMGHGYSHDSSLKLVGDRHALTARQRMAVVRASCSEEQRARRQAHRVESDKIAGSTLWIDGFNLGTTIEAALGGGILFKGRDGCFRDLASMHGNYRVLTDTLPALELISTEIARLKVARVHWYLDQPVSNSGRLKGLILEHSAHFGFETEVELVPDPDPILREARLPHIVITADSQILDGCEAWFPLAENLIRNLDAPWIDFTMSAS